MDALCVCLCVCLFTTFTWSLQPGTTFLCLWLISLHLTARLFVRKKHARRMFFPPKDSFVLPARCHRMKAEPAIFSLRSFRVNFCVCSGTPWHQMWCCHQNKLGQNQGRTCKNTQKNQPLEKWRNFSNTDCHEDRVKGRVSPCQMLTSTVAKWWSVAWV